MKRRLWVVEGLVTPLLWLPVVGGAFTNKRFAWDKQRELRARFKKDTFRVVQYVPALTPEEE